MTIVLVTKSRHWMINESCHSPASMFTSTSSCVALLWINRQSDCLQIEQTAESEVSTSSRLQHMRDDHSSRSGVRVWILSDQGQLESVQLPAVPAVVISTGPFCLFCSLVLEKDGFVMDFFLEDVVKTLLCTSIVATITTKKGNEVFKI